MKLEDALVIAKRIVEDVRPAVSRIEIAGSIRREKENVKDIELVALVNDYDLLFEKIRNHGKFIKPGSHDIVDYEPVAGAKYLRVLLHEEVKLDFFIASRDNWGPIFCMRTGSGVGPDGSTFTAFIPHMFRRWKKVSNGGKMVGGIPTRPDGTGVPCYEEEDFFNLLKVEYVHPRDRISFRAIKPKL
jgi:DNA polymerase/3'-5' exonuclease PolX